MSTLKLDLEQNAEGFLKEAIEKALKAEKNVPEWKFAVLHIVQAIELTLKELLKREHPWLIYENVDKPEFTVSLKTACNRLVRLNRHGIRQDDVDCMKKAADVRNDIVHHQVELNVKELRLWFAELLVLLQSLWKAHLGKALRDLVEEGTWKQLLEIKEHGEKLFGNATERMRLLGIDSSRAWRCRACGWKAFVEGSQMNECFQCGHRESIKECILCGERTYENNGYRQGVDDDPDAPFICHKCLIEKVEGRPRFEDLY